MKGRLLLPIQGGSHVDPRDATVNTKVSRWFWTALQAARIPIAQRVVQKMQFLWSLNTTYVTL